MSIQKKGRSISITVPGPILYGSITTVTIKCGKIKCPCRNDPTKQHGPYYQWTGIIDGKRTTKMIPEELIRDCKQRLKNYEKLVQKLEILRQQAIKNAPWNHKPP